MEVKEARIPEPWQLQLLMPLPCKYFLRMNVNRQTSILEIKIAASKQCKLREECFDVFANDLLLSNFETVESSNFFTSHKFLRLSSHLNCKL